MTEESRSAAPPSPPEPVSEAAPALLDGAGAAAVGLDAALAERRKVAADPGRKIAERLEAFEDVFDSEVGDTTLARARNLEREFGIRQLYLKFEGGNPTGTQKDRIAFAQSQDALRRGFDAITVATCGNYGSAIAVAASTAGLRTIIYIPNDYQTRRLEEMAGRGAEIVRTPGDYEAAVAASQRRAAEDGIYDGNPGGANTALQLQAYGAIAFEIYDELRDAPAAVAAPVSNGTTLAGIYRGFLSLYRRGKTSRLPRMVAGSTSGKNPIVRSFLKNHPSCEDLDPEKVRETALNEPLVNWHSYDGDLALAAVRESGGWASDVSDQEMRRHARVLREREGLNVLPASNAGLEALLEGHRKTPLGADRYVAVLTARR